jgi:hypothetical protein
VEVTHLKSVEQGGLPGAVQPQDEDPHLAAAEQVLEVTEQSAHLSREKKFASERFLKKNLLQLFLLTAGRHRHQRHQKLERSRNFELFHHATF